MDSLFFIPRKFLKSINRKEHKGLHKDHEEEWN